MNDEELVAKACFKRDKDAFGELVRRHLPMAERVTAGMVRDREIARELAQGGDVTSVPLTGPTPSWRELRAVKAVHFFWNLPPSIRPSSSLALYAVISQAPSCIVRRNSEAISSNVEPR